ncbi:MAG: zinc-ribbon domain-containing protein [Ruminococcus sp.]
MFCKHCGRQIDDNVDICPNCGKSVKAVDSGSVASDEQHGADNLNKNTVEVNPQDVQPVNPVTPTENSETPQTTVSENTNVQKDFGVNTDYQVQPKKKRKLPKVLAIVGVCVVAIAVVVALNFSFILGTLIKTFGSPSDYMRFVEAKGVTSFASNVAEAYGDNILELFSSDDSQTGNLSVKLSDEGRELLTSLAGTGEDVDLDWLKEANLSVTSNRDGDSQQVKLGIGLGGKDIISADCILDTENKEVYFALPELSKKYIKSDLDGMDEFSFDDIDKIKEALPEESNLSEMIEKYAGVIIDTLDDVDLDDGSLEIKDTDEDCTELTLTISERQVLEICQEILKEAEDDDELMDLIGDLVESVESVSGTTGIDVDDSIDDLSGKVEDELDSLDGDGEEVFTLVDYVNGRHEIIGRSIEVNDEEVLSYGKVEDGDNVYYQLKIGDEFVINGEAEESGDKLDGEFAVEADGEEVLIVETKDFDLDKLEDFELEGTLSVKPGAYFSEASGSAIPVAISDVALEMKFLEESADISLLMQGEELITISANTETKDSESIDIPDDSDVCDVSDQTALSDYLTSMDVNSIIDNLKDAGIPEELLEEIQSSMLNSAMSSY